MAFTSAVNEGPIPQEYVDQDVVQRTVRVYLTAKASSLREFVNFMKEAVPVFSLANCQAIWKTDRYGQIFLTMKDVESAQVLLDLQCVSVNSGTDGVHFKEIMLEVSAGEIQSFLDCLTVRS